MLSLEYVKTIGGGRKIRPYDIAFSADGRYYVLNHATGFGAGRFTVCNFDEDIIAELPDNAGDGPFAQPVAIAFDRDERMFVLDEAKHRVTILDKNAGFLGEWGANGSGDGELDRPSALQFDRNDDCYVADQMNHRVQKFTKDGEYLLQWGSFGDGDGQFNMPWGLNLDSQGCVYVADWRNDRIQKFTPDGEFLAAFGESEGETASSTGPRAWWWTTRDTYTWATGATSGCRCWTPTAGLSPSCTDRRRYQCGRAGSSTRTRTRSARARRRTCIRTCRRS